MRNLELKFKSVNPFLFVYLLLILLLPFQGFSQTYTSNFASAAGNYSTISPSGGVCLAPAFTGASNVADADLSLNSYARVSGLLSATLLCTNTTYAIRSKLNFPTGTTFAPAGFQAGFRLSLASALSLSLLQSNISLRTYLGGTLRQTVSGANLTGISLLSSTGPVYVYFTSGLSFDEVELVFNTAIIPVGVVFDYRFYNAFGSQNILPVKLSSFRSETSASGTNLKWTSAREENLDRYELERADNSQNFTRIATIPAKGSAGNYSYLDLTAGSGDLYYRLKSIDKDGSFDYSSNISVSLTRKDDFKIYPNPVRQGETINVSIPTSYSQKPLTLKIYNTQGQQLSTQPLKQGNISFGTSGYAAGIYLAKIVSGDEVIFTQKIIVN